MKTTIRLSKRFLAMLLMLAMLIGTLPIQALAEETPPEQHLPESDATVTDPAQSLADSLNGLTETWAGGDNVTLVTYHEVIFELPEKDGEAEAEVTEMEESTMVPDGTLISELDTPHRAGCLFLGWYYDAALTRIAGDEDTINEDLVLYPRFELQNGINQEANDRYIHADDVTADYQVVVSSFGLTKEQAASLIRIRDYTEGDGDPESGMTRPFVLTEVPLPEQPLPDLTTLDLTEEQLEQVQIAIEAYKEGRMSGPELWEGLEFLEVPTETGAIIVTAYAPDSIEEIVQFIEAREAEEKERLMELVRELDPDVEITWPDDTEAADAEETATEEAEPGETARFAVLPESGAWTKGHYYEVEILDTARLRFDVDGEPAGTSFIYNSFNVFKENVDTMQLDPRLKFIPFAEIEGVELGKGLINYAMDENGNIIEQQEDDTKKVLRYTGSLALAAGDVLAVYEGELLERGDVNGEVTYVRLAESLEDGRFIYEMPDLMEVLYVPDNIPLADDGSYEDGTIVVDTAMLDLYTPVYVSLNVNDRITVDEGDYLSFYNSSDLAAALEDESLIDQLQYINMGRITGVQESDGKLTISYVPATYEEWDETGNYHINDVPIDMPMSEEERMLLGMQIQQQIDESGFAEQAGQYLRALILDKNLEEDLTEAEYEDVMRRATFELPNGDALSLEEVRLLGSITDNVTVQVTSTSAQISDSTRWGDAKKAKKLSVTVGFKISFSIIEKSGKQVQITIDGCFTGSQEVGWSYSADYWRVKRKDGKSGREYKFWAQFKLRSYTSLGFTARITFEIGASEEDGPWTMLKNAALGFLDNNGANKVHDQAIVLLDKMAETAKQAEAYRGDGGLSTEKADIMSSALPDAYAAFVASESKAYKDIYDYTFLEYSQGLGVFGILRVSISVDFVLRLKLSALLGLGVTYEVQKNYDITMYSKSHMSEKSITDVTNPTFTLGFFCFGTIGIKAGIRLDLRMGLFDTDWDSVGLIGEVGAYFEAYGFFYFIYYKSNNSYSRMQGSLYWEVGIYLELYFYAQIFGGWRSTRIDILKEQRYPLVSGGTKNYPMDFEIRPGDRRLNLEIPGSTNSAKVDGSVFMISSMDLTSGAVSSASMDSCESYMHSDVITGAAKLSQIATAFINHYYLTLSASAGASADEKNFFVEVYDVDPNTGWPNGKHSFRYDPVDNTVYVEPGQDGDVERWGKLVFTYKNPTFGISSNTLRRTVNLHWKGETIDVPVVYEIYSNYGDVNERTVVDTKTIHCFKGAGTKYILTGEDMYRIPGTKMTSVTLVKNGKRTRNWIPQEGKEIEIKPEDGIPLSLAITYKYENTEVNWTLMTPGDKKTPIATARTTEKGNTPVEDAVPAQMREIIDNTDRYHVQWYVVLNGLQKKCDKINGQSIELIGIFKLNQHQVTWILPDTVTEKVKYGTPLYPPQDPYKQGYTLKNWEMDGEEFEPGTPMPNRDVTIKAKWKKNKYNAVWVVDDTVAAFTEISYNAKLSTKKISTNMDLFREHYTLKWTQYAAVSNLSVEGTTYTGETGTFGELPSSFRMPDYDVVIVGEWVPNEHTVTWVSDGIENIEEKVAYGEKLQAPDPGTVEGYTFAGWIIHRGNTTEPLPDGMTMPDEDLLIEATWEPNLYPVYFVIGANVKTIIPTKEIRIGIGNRTITVPTDGPLHHTLEGGTVVAEMELPYGSLVRDAESSVNITRDGYSAVWTMVYPYRGQLDDEWTDFPTPSFAATVPIGGLIVLGDWEAHIRQVTWQAEGEEPVTQKLSYDQIIPSPPDIPAREGYTLGTWMIGDIPWQPDMTMPDEDITITANWILNEHRVLWEIDNGLVKEETVSYGAALTPPVPESREGYTLSGWTIDGEELAADATMPDKPLIIRAYWIAHQHRATWILEDQTIKEETLDYGASLTPPARQRMGYDLSGWSLEDGSPLAQDATMPDRDLEIKATWIPRAAKDNWILYNTDSGEMTQIAESFEAEFGKLLSQNLPATVSDALKDERYSYEIYSLQGNLTAEQAREQKNSWTKTGETETVPPGEMTYILQRTPVMADVTWAYDTGDVTESVWVGAKLTAPTEPERTGYRFEQWEDENGQIHEYPPAGGIRLIPRFTALEFTVTWMDDGKTVRTDTIAYGTKLTPPTLPERTGYLFEGWETDQGPLPEDAVMSDHDLTVTACWKKNSYQATWIIDGETVGSGMVTCGTKLTPPAVSPRTGHTLSGWTVDGKPLTDDMTMPEHDVTGTASWSANSYQATWIVDGETVGSGMVTYGTTLTPPSVSPRAGYALSGWTVDGKPLTGDMTMPDHAVTGTASWSVNSYELTWESDGKTVATQHVAYGSKLTPPTVAGKEGYSLIGWTTADGKALPDSMPDTAMKAVAVWKINRYNAAWTVDGETVQSDTLEYGSVLKAPEPEKRHYTRSAWMLNGTQLTEGTTMPANNIIITASWIANPHTATWKDAENGKTLETKTVAYGQPIPTGPSAGIKTGYDFKGWAIDGAVVTSNTTMPDEDIVLLPQWDIRSHFVFWTVDGKLVKSENVRYGSKLEPPAETKKGYTLTDWMVNGIKLDSSFTMPDDSVTVAATWKVNEYNLTWAIDGKAVSAGVVPYGSKLDPPKVDPREGFELSAWKIKGKEIDQNTTMPDDDLTVEAKWEHNTHVWDDGKVTEEATCTSEGTLIQTCRYCTETKETVLPKDITVHKSTSIQNAVKATCGKDGYEGDTVCKDCKVVIAEGKTIPMTGEHKTWITDKVVTEATCVREGVETQKCSECGEIRTHTIAVNPQKHSPGTTPVGKKDATCAEAGYTGDIRCKECGKVIEQGTEIPATGEHSWNSARKQTASASEPGLVVSTCTKCGQQKEEYEPIAPKLDSLFMRSLRGNTGETFIPGMSENVVIVLLEDIVSAAKERNVETLNELDPALFFQAYVGTSAASEDQRGIQAGFSWNTQGIPKLISDLQEGYTAEVIIEPADSQKYEKASVQIVMIHLNHQYDYVSVVTPPTCTTSGKGSRKCAFCDQTTGIEELPPDPEKHTGNTYITGQKEATANTAGYTGDKICADCGALLEAGKEIPPTGTTP